jgi:hypothetical protein
VSVVGRVWGYIVGYTLTHPISIIHASLCLRPDASPTDGLMPWSPLGRQHWAALPARIVERLLSTLCSYVQCVLPPTTTTGQANATSTHERTNREWVNKWCGERLGLDMTQVLGWLLPDADERLRAERDDIEEDEEEEDEEEEPSLVGQVAWGAKRWLLSRVPCFASGCVTST